MCFFYLYEIHLEMLQIRVKNNMSVPRILFYFIIYLSTNHAFRPAHRLGKFGLHPLRFKRLFRSPSLSSDVLKFLLSDNLSDCPISDESSVLFFVWRGRSIQYNHTVLLLLLAVVSFFERDMRFELTTPNLASSCSTN